MSGRGVDRPRVPVSAIERVLLSMAPASLAAFLSAFLAPFTPGLLQFEGVTSAGSILWPAYWGAGLGFGAFMVVPRWLLVVAPVAALSRTSADRLWGLRGVLWSVGLWLAWTSIVSTWSTIEYGGVPWHYVGQTLVQDLPINLCCFLGTGLCVRAAARMSPSRSGWFIAGCVVFGIVTAMLACLSFLGAVSSQWSN